MQNKQAEQNLYETAGAEQTERSERSETRSSVNRFAYMSAEAPALRGELRGSADHPTAEGSIFAYWLDGALQSLWDFLRTGCSDSISTME